MKGITIGLMARLAANSVPTHASDLSQKIANSHPDTYRHRAQEAAVWAMPMINYKANRDGVFANDVTYNDVTYFSRMQDVRFQLVTPNDTTPYFLTFWNVKQQPVVIEIPAANGDVVLFGTFMDSWHRPLADFGPKGADQGRGAKYLIVGPNFDQPIPQGYHVIRSSTYEGYLGARPIIKDSSQASIDMAASYVRQLKVYSLGEAANTRYVDLAGKPVNSITQFNDHYFDNLNQLLQIEPLEEKDKVMIAMLKSLGLEQGKPFEPNASERVLLAKGAEQAHDYLADMYHNVLIPPYYSGKQWQFLVNKSVPETQFTFDYPDYLDIDNRGALYYAITSSVKKMGGATAYLSSLHDSNGVVLDGNKSYRLHVDAKVPAQQFWSATVYDYDSAAWQLDQPKVSIGSSEPDLKVNQDGSVDIYFGATAPVDKTNWVGTSKNKPFFVMFRFYGPNKAVFDKSWQLNDLELLD